MMKTRLFNPWVLTFICLIFFLTAITISVLSTKRHYNSSPGKEWILVGGVTSSFASFRIRSSTDNVKFVVSESPSFEGPIFVREQVTATTNGTLDPVHELSVDILTPNTKYYYATLQNGDSVIRQGSFQTPATEGEAFNFKIAVAGCAWTASEHNIFSEIASRNPLFMLHLGDFHYEDISENDLDLRINAVDLVMGSESQRELFSKVPLAYTWDDHDWLGNDSDRDNGESGARDTALRSYQIAFPHHALAVEGEAVPIYHAFTIGTVRFIVSDLRSEASGSSMYSKEQRDWLYNELSQAAQYDFVIWATSKPWIGDAEDGEDNWLGSAVNRSDLSDFISTTLAETQNLLAVSSDAHMLAFDDGSNTYYGTSTNSTLSFPILQSGPLDRLGSVKGGPFSDGCRTIKFERNNQFSTIAFAFDGSEPCLEITTYDVDKEVEKRKLCGKIFTESSPGTGSCVMALCSTTTYVYVGIASFLWFAASVGACYFLGISSGFLVASILMIFLLATVLTAPIPFAQGISQWNMSPTDIIAFAEMLTASIYCYVWYYLARKAKIESEEPIFPGNSDNDSAQASK